VLSRRRYADDQLCLAIENWEGPAVVMWRCNTGENEEFVVSGAKNTTFKAIYV
jgi:hypothetical protein